MPIVKITSSVENDRELLAGIAAEIKRAGASALETTPDNIWVVFPRVQSLDSKIQAHPPIIEIMANAGRSLELKTRFVKTVAGIVAKALELSAESVWVHYHEMSPQNVWFNGSWTQP